MLPRNLRKRLSCANVIATVALFFAFTGASMAGVKYIASGDPAGGDLSGTYPNPTIGTGKVNSGKIADGAITSPKFSTDAISPNADKLDGNDSSAFLSGFEIVRGTDIEPVSAGNYYDSDVACPDGKQAIASGWDENTDDRVSIVLDEPSSEVVPPQGNGWHFRFWVAGLPPYQLRIKTWAICAFV